ncbi:tRNA 2-thiouridine(34) synthase MnmA [Rhodothermus profundi]|uniref:tRNA-specific 2-thiouridylase MnmA n=1 Tax=Rhodothermus profundi TaxID=633813 RepID=A0A1M6VGP5_9BACT|nr:tRNA 2-thiouridine(34) synthase MnmA [Rhodothermus profundi]SHK80446.1 tRNA (5-methylaminomethyl-2-thiouridylate)-methyltransferase [Rhodothermus profundi]
MSRHGRVLVAMSGGVDSSVTAALLHEQGYEVVGITMKTWDYTSSGVRTGKEVGCCSLESMNDARAVAVRLGFPHFIVDIREEFGDWVIERFTDEYLAGRTPNPCILCNTHIKWAALLRRADQLGCDYIATGHYARIRYDEALGRYVISRGRDLNKDQSYVLWGIAQEHLARTLLPLGDYTKPEIRRMAAEMGFERLAHKPDSYEICFIPDNDYRRFLRQRVPDLDQKVGPGKFVLKDGTVVGTHQGYPFYTIGQRHGLGLALGYPVYVTHIDPATNTITVGPREELLRQRLVARQINLIKYPDLREERPAVGKIRYKDEGAPCLVWQEEDALHVAFAEPRPAITPGQAVVLYEGDDVLAGGWIYEVLEDETTAAGAADRRLL